MSRFSTWLCRSCLAWAKTRRRFAALQRGVAWGVLGLLSAVYPIDSTADTFAEYQLKAAFLLRLSEFVDWDARQNGQGKFKLCVVAPSETFRAFEPLTGRLIKGLPVEVVAESAAGEPPCSLVFLGRKSEMLDDALFGCTLVQGCLAVGETHQAVEQARTIIALVRQERRIRVEINLKAAKDAGLQIDSDLLEVATIVDSAS